MLCFFCSSSNHLSENCDICVSRKSRKERARSKNCCENCLSSSHIQPSWLCYPYQKCYNCFSREHHNVFCPYSSTKVQTFLPNINTEIIPRFYQMLNFNEQLKLAFSTPLALTISKIQLCQIYRYICYEAVDAAENSAPINKVVVTNKLQLRNISLSKMNTISNHLSSCGTTIIVATIVRLEHCKLSAKDFLLLLPQNTKILYCTDVQFHEKMEFVDILEKVSNIFQIKLYKTNISFESNWFEKYLKHRNVNYLKQLKIDTEKFAFDGEIDHGDFRIYHFE